MRHRKEGRKLSRTASHRKALLSALSTALILHKKIKTTVAKAKEARRIVEPLITRARNSFKKEKGGGAIDVAARRHIAKFIRDRQAVKTLFTEIAEKVGDRAGGYTRVVRLGRRYGDGAEIAVLELVDYNLAQDTSKRKARAAKARKKGEKIHEAEAVAEEMVKTKKTRRGRSKKVKDVEEQTEDQMTEQPIEKIEEIASTETIDSSSAEPASEETKSEEPKA